MKMNQNEKLELYEVKKIIKRHTMWGGTKWSYGNMIPDEICLISIGQYRRENDRN